MKSFHFSCSRAAALLKVASISASFASAFVAASCIRSLEPIPPVGEGAFVTGIVVKRDAVSGDFVGDEGVLVRAAGTSIAETTDSRGFFQLERLSLGPIVVHVMRRNEEGIPEIGRVIDGIRAVSDGQTIDLGEVQVRDPGVLTGALYEGADGSLGSAAQPAAGSLVVVAGTSFKAVVEANGLYNLPTMPEGRFDLAGFRSGFAPIRTEGVQVRAGETTRVRDQILSRAANDTSVLVTGRVDLRDRDDDGGIQVTFLDEASTTKRWTIESTSEGTYQLTLPVGVYRARFEFEGYVKVELPGVGVLQEGVIGLVPVLLHPGGEGDIDGDGLTDDEDSDIDNDGCPNESDAFPQDPFACLDTDQDGIPDNLDDDDDGDGLSDAEEESPGADGWITRTTAFDSDDDGHADARDVCPSVADPLQEDSDGDGIGDHCDGGASVAPVILSFQPTTAASGAQLEIFGRNFEPNANNVVRFGNGGFVNVPRNRALADRLTVTVPTDAQSGPLTVTSRGRSTTSTASFTFLPAPEIVDFVPTVVRVSSVVVVRGRHFDRPGLNVSVNGVPGTVDGSVAKVSVNGEILDVIRMRVGQRSESGPIQVLNDHGKAESRAPLTILSGPSITNMRPNPAVVGHEVLLLGEGFNLDDTGGDIQVFFSGVQSPVRPSDTSVASILRIVVPAGAVTGTVRVVHPAGETTSLVPLIIDDGTPALADISPRLVKPGDTVNILGLHLATATRVVFGGNAEGLDVVAHEDSISVRVPPNVRPGPIKVDFAGGAPSQTSHFSVPVLETSSSPELESPVEGVGYSPTGRQAYVFLRTDPDLVVLDVDTMQELQRIPLPLDRSAFDQLHAAVVAPDGRHAILIDGSQGAWKTNVLDLTTFTVVGTPCQDRPSNDGSGWLNVFPFQFDLVAGLAFSIRPNNLPTGLDGIWQIDLTTGACQLIEIEDLPAAGIRSMLVDLPGTLLVGHRTAGMGLLNVGRTLAPRRSMVTPFSGSGVSGDQLFWSPGRRYLFNAPGDTVGPVLRYVPYDEAAPLTINGTGGPGTVQSSDGRWLLGLGSTGSYFLDLLDIRLARTGTTSFSTRRSAAHPSDPEFLVLDSDRGGARKVARIRILE